MARGASGSAALPWTHFGFLVDCFMGGNDGSRRKLKAFTIIELLVVIAIMSILMTILLPALKKARDVAFTADCKSRLRTLALANFNYASDWNDCIPHATGDTPDICASTLMLAQYTVDSISASTSAAKPSINNPAMCQAFVRNNDLAYLGKGIHPAAPYQEYSRVCWYHFTSYRQSTNLYFAYRGTSGPYYSAGVRGDRTAYNMIRLREIKYPSEGICYFEGKNGNNTTGFDNSADPIAYKPSHGNAFPSVMFDGSARVWGISYQAYGRCCLYNGHPNWDYPTSETFRAWLCYLYFTY